MNRQNDLKSGRNIQFLELRQYQPDAIKNKLINFMFGSSNDIELFNKNYEFIFKIFYQNKVKNVKCLDQKENIYKAFKAYSLNSKKSL